MLAFVRLFILCVALLSPLSSASDYFQQFIDPKDGYLDASSWLLDNAYGFLPIPILITEPAVGYGGGVAAVFFHETEQQKLNRALIEAGDTSVKPSIPTKLSFIGAMGTENGTKGWVGGHYGSYKADRYRYTGAVGQMDVNMKFYWSAPELELPAVPSRDIPFRFNISADMIYQDFRLRLGDSRFFAGAKFVLIDTDVQLKELGDVDLSQLPDKWQSFLGKETRSTGLGLTLSYDSRETLWGAERGNDSLLEVLDYGSALGGEHSFSVLKFYSHQYFVMAPNVFGGVRLDYRTVSDDAPFYQVPYIDLMGIPAMRYQAENVLVGELNVRWMPHPRWSLIGFSGLGRGAETFSELEDANSRITKGLGFRYLIARLARMHMGMDYAWGPEESAVYFKVGVGW